MRADRFPYDCWLAAGQFAGASSGAFFQRRVYERRLGAYVAGASSGAFFQRRVYERRLGADVAGASSGAFFERRVYERRVAAHVAGASSGAFFQRRVNERRVAGCCFSWRTNDVRLICFHDVPTAAMNETLHNADAEPLCP
jgi:hypothetical protein